MKLGAQTAWQRPSRPQDSSPAKVLRLAGLLQQIGSPEILSELAFPSQRWPLGKAKGTAGLRHFLENYQTRVLFPLELPATARAFALSVGRRSQELISLDQQLCWQPSLSAFACASKQIGRTQLHCLWPLRDERMVRRYLLAVAQGEASGWHMIVFGLTLAVYSHPLRQGLVHYARQTLTGLARAAARSQSLPELACADILQSLFRRLPEAIEQAALEFASVEGLPADALIQS